MDCKNVEITPQIILSILCSHEDNNRNTFTALYITSEIESLGVYNSLGKHRIITKYRILPQSLYSDVVVWSS
jgi:hypothetical protein